MPSSEVHAAAKAVAGLATRSTDMQKEALSLVSFKAASKQAGTR